ncbi:hypothetical protein [Prescottella equi]|uniref:hypothetical protein n=1 Tax=Rhodococcus hoagii TaxID=43767 RepID=UPI00111C47A5|nr:hypothetical protein [Prescottella equi]
MSQDSAGSRFAEVLEQVMQKDGVTNKASVIARVLGVEERTARSRLANGGFRVDEIPGLIKALRIEPDVLLRALLPDLDLHSVTVDRKKWQMRAQALEDELTSRRQSGEIQLDLVEDLAATGRWAVSVLPHRSGPTSEAEVLAATRIAVTPARPGLVPPGLSVREALVDEFGAKIRDRAVFLADHVRPRPASPIGTDDVVYLSIPSFTADRVPSPSPVQLPKLHSATVLVLALTQSAWRETTAAIAARAMGWGLTNTSSIGRAVTPPQDPKPDDFIETVNKIRNDGLQKLLLEPPKDTFVHHVGRAVVGEHPEPHSLTSVINSDFRDRIPFVVLLSETDRVIARQSHKARQHANGKPRFSTEQWTAWRDELRKSVKELPATNRVILPFDFPWDQQDEHDTPPSDPTILNQEMWRSCAETAEKIIGTLRSLGSINRNARFRLVDDQAVRILDSVRPYQ